VIENQDVINILFLIYSVIIGIVLFVVGLFLRAARKKREQEDLLREEFMTKGWDTEKLKRMKRTTPDNKRVNVTNMIDEMREEEERKVVERENKEKKV